MSILGFIVGTSITQDNVPLSEMFEVIPFLPLTNFISLVSFVVIPFHDIETAVFCIGHVSLWVSAIIYFWKKKKWALVLTAISGVCLTFFAYELFLGIMSV
jgi:hypothetical protein